MTVLRIPLLFAAIAALAASGVAVAQQPPGGVLALPPKERFEATDRNKDGKVSKDEFVAVIVPDARPYIDAIWDNRDTNKDGWLSEAEMNSNAGAGSRRGAPPAAAGRGGAPTTP